MARARNIKPGLFSNDELAEIEPLGRLLFIGLWTIADFKGDFVWREKRIKAQLLPYDNVDIKKIAINLDKSGFIRFYSDSDKIYVNIVNFSKHQNPHKNEREKGSEIPSFTGIMRQAIDLERIAINLDKSGLNQNDYDINRADSLNPIPDSLNPIPDSLEEKQKTKKRFSRPSESEVIEYQSEKGLNLNGFFDYYESNGWQVGKNKMKDWQAAARGWSGRQIKNTGTNTGYKSKKLEGTDYTAGFEDFNL